MRIQHASGASIPPPIFSGIVNGRHCATTPYPLQPSDNLKWCKTLFRHSTRMLNLTVNTPTHLSQRTP